MSFGLELTLTPISPLQIFDRWGNFMQQKVKVIASNPLFLSQ